MVFGIVCICINRIRLGASSLKQEVSSGIVTIASNLVGVCRRDGQCHWLATASGASDEARLQSAPWVVTEREAPTIGVRDRDSGGLGLSSLQPVQRIIGEILRSRTVPIVQYKGNVTVVYNRSGRT